MEFGLILFFVLLFVAGVVLYFLPGLIAGRRKHKYSVLITILNIFLGWTCFGWIALLVWAFADKTSNSAVDLKILAELKEKGLLSDEEFEQKKKNLLDKI